MQSDCMDVDGQEPLTIEPQRPKPLNPKIPTTEGLKNKGPKEGPAFSLDAPFAAAGPA